MANFKVEIELDWLESHDDGVSLDETLKDKFFKELAKKMSTDIASKVVDEQKDKFNKELKATIDTYIADEYGQFINSPVALYDSWGKKTDEFPTMRDLIVHRLDKYLSTMVDSNGKPDGSSYGNRQSRLEYLIGQQFNQALDKKIKDLGAEINKKVDEKLNKIVEEVNTKIETAINQNLGGKIATILGIDDVLKLGSGKK